MKESNEVTENVFNQTDEDYENYPVITKPLNWWVGIWWWPNIRKMKMAKKVEALLKTLAHPNPKVRWTIIRALGELWNLPDMIDLGHRNLDVRAQAAEVLGNCNDPRTLMPLIASVWDPGINRYEDVIYYYPVRINAILALGKRGDPRAIEPLIESFRRRAWGWGYPTIGNEPLYICLTKFGQPMLIRLLTLLQDEQESIRDLATITLGYFGDSQAILSQVLKKEKDRRLKGIAIGALYQIGDERIIPVFDTALKHENWEGQLDIVGSLSKLQNPAIIPVLKSALHRVDRGEQERMMIDKIARFGTPEALRAIEEYKQEKSL